MYSEKNGFINTEIFIAELTNLRSWFKVKKFDDHEIRQIISDKPAYVLVRTEKINNDQEFKNIIYRDYSRDSKKQKDQNFDYDEHSFMGKVKNTIPTAAREVFDVSGAGDTVIAVLAMALVAGGGFEESAKLANLAAGIVVGKVGTATVSTEEMLSCL